MTRLLVVVVALFLATALAWSDPIRVLVDGAPVAFDVPPLMHQGAVYVPLRGVFEKMGAKVQYNAATAIVTVSRKDTTLKIKVGDPFAQVNGESVPMVTPAVSLRQRVFVPLRFLSEEMGLEVDWEPSSSTVSILSK